ncbi:MAG: glycosyltransferase [Tannerellaceae bacterium]|nr:glycosyltransferase [Tannerellaceae bacterium]
MRKKLLILHSTYLFGGAERSLDEFIKNSYAVFDIYLATSLDSLFFDKVKRYPITSSSIHIPYLKKNLFCFLKYFLPTLYTSFKILRILRQEKIPVVYCNTYRSLPFCLFVRLFTGVKVVCHCRDNVYSTAIHWLITSFSDEIIVISKHIHSQFKTGKPIYLIYNGVSAIQNNRIVEDYSIREEYKIPVSSPIIATIGQILPWKNQLDFVLVADKILSGYPDCFF